MTPCHAQKYQEALEGMRQYASRMWQGALPPWAEAAMQQHAHYYAAQTCGEDTMRFSNYQTRAALGITRSGTMDGRTITLEGYGRFGVIGAGDNAAVNYHESNVTAGKQCPKDMSVRSPWSTYCGCMYGDKDRTSNPEPGKEGGAYNFALTSPRWACQKVSELWGFAQAPWDCRAVIGTVVLSAGKADPLRHMNGTFTTGPKGAEYRRCAEKVLKEAESAVSALDTALRAVGLPTTRETLQNLGIIPPDATPGTGGGSTPITDPTAYKNTLMAMTDSELVAQGRNEFVNAEIAFRAQTPCGPRRARQAGGTSAADGRPMCRASSIDYIGGVIGTVGPLPGGPPPLPGKKDASSAMPTGLLLGGAAVAVAAIFLLKK